MDECAVENGGCAHVCQDTQFSYSCSCNEGFTLNDDEHSCTGDFTLQIFCGSIALMKNLLFRY